MDDLTAARSGDEAAFARLVAPFRAELAAHCYRMLGSPLDAEDALQEALVGAWRGLAGFEGRASLRTWLFRIATNACLRLGARRPRRVPAVEAAPSRSDVIDLGEMVTGPVYVEPFPDRDLPAARVDPAARYEARESVELAFVAALQRLPARQRAVLVLRDVLGFPAADVAAALDSTEASVNSALQRARAALDADRPIPSQQAVLAALGDEGQRALVSAFVAAWERADVDGLVALLADDVRFAMPPLPAWYDGQADVARFFAERIFATPWRLVPATASGQLAVVAYMDGRLGALAVLTVRDGPVGPVVAELTGFLDPAIYRLFGLVEEFSAADR